MRAKTPWSRSLIGVGIGLVSASALVANSVKAQLAEPPIRPGDFGEPSSEQIADSIHVWDPTGHVEVIETETTEGDETVISLDTDILFAFGSAELPSSAGARIAELLIDIPQGAAVCVTGHTDDIGSDVDNVVLSQQRADAVAAAVRTARPDLALDVEGRGESEPVVSNGDPEGREANRRVEIRYGG